LELYCELLLARIGLLEAKDCDPGLEEAVKSIIYAAPRVDVKELQQVRFLLVEKYGKEFGTESMENKDGKIAERVLNKLQVKPPDQALVEAYLKEIARTYGITWPKRETTPDVAQDSDDDDSPSGGQAIKLLEEPLTTQELSRATPPRDLGPKSPISIAPPSPSSDNISPKLRLPAPPDLKPTAKMSGLRNQATAGETKSSGGSGGKADPIGGKIPDIDELAKRFAALKK
jgi:vacuolar protein sorting-associated protein IST1